MKIVIAGVGKVGTRLAYKLSTSGHDITVVDEKSQVLDNCVDRYDVISVHGNIASMDTMLQAGVTEADLLIAATSADETNLLACMTAHGLNPKLATIARIRNPEYSDQIYRMREIFPISLAVNPDRQAALEIERILKYPGFLKRDSFAKGRAEIVEFRLNEQSVLCDTALADLMDIVKTQVLVCAVQRSGDVIIPSGDFILKKGDRLFVTGSTQNLTTFLKNLGIITHKVKRVMICGGSRISYYLASSLLRNGIHVQIIEKDQARCEKLADMLPKATIVCGDASDQYLLESERIQSYDAMVSLTGMDELNVVISLYAKSCKVNHVVTKVGHVENNLILDGLDVGSLISPKETCCSTIIRYIRAMENQTGAALTVHSVADGKAEAVEFRVNSTTAHSGEMLKNIRVKNNYLIAGIIHVGRIEIPNGNSFFVEGDTVIVLSKGDNALNNLNDIFE